MTREALANAYGGIAEPTIVEHKLSEADVKGPFAEKIPAKMEDMKELKALAYTSPKEKLAEQFHMSPEASRLLLILDRSFEKPGDTILVANVSGGDLRRRRRVSKSTKANRSSRSLTNRERYSGDGRGKHGEARA